jgi:hypothetical protein
MQPGHMTETEWLASNNNPLGLFRQVRSRLSARKLQLLSCGCARLAWDVLSGEQRQVVMIVEQHADFSGDPAEYQRVVEAAFSQLTEVYEETRDLTHEKAISHLLQALVCTPTDEGAKRAIEWVVASYSHRPASTERMATTQQVRKWVCDCVRELVGNPFQERAATRGDGPSASWMTWVSETALALARGIEASQAYDRMPILADALQDDGCGDDELLAHLREPRAHLRGCWALDLVLGKN